VAEEISSNVSAAGDPQRFRDAHRELLADSSIQFDLERFQPPPVPGWVRWLVEALQGSGPFLEPLFWSLLAVGAGLLLYALARWLDRSDLLRRQRGATDRSGESEEWRVEEAPARALLDEADALAATGRYAEAAHLLLFRSIEVLDRRRPDLVRPALTSRDIAGAPALPSGPRAAFAQIVMLVERSLFGGAPVAESDWRGCRSAYEAFAFASEWRA
jgi:hypothetical protein